MERHLLRQIEKQYSGFIDKLTAVSDSLDGTVPMVTAHLVLESLGYVSFRRTKAMKRQRNDSWLKDKRITSAKCFTMHSCCECSEKPLFSSHPHLLNLVMCLLKRIAELKNSQLHLQHQDLLCLEYSVFPGKETKGNKGSCLILVAIIPHSGME